MVDFAVAKKSPIHISVCVRLKVARTSPTSRSIHLTTDLVIRLEGLILLKPMLPQPILVDSIFSEFSLLDTRIRLS